MNAKPLILLLLSMPLLAFGQSNSSIDLITGIEYSYRTLSTSSSDAIVNSIMERRDTEETGKLSGRMLISKATRPWDSTNGTLWATSPLAPITISGKGCSCSGSPSFGTTSPNWPMRRSRNICIMSVWRWGCGGGCRV